MPSPLRLGVYKNHLRLLGLVMMQTEFTESIHKNPLEFAETEEFYEFPVIQMNPENPQDTFEILETSHRILKCQEPLFSPNPRNRLCTLLIQIYIYSSLSC